MALANLQHWLQRRAACALAHRQLLMLTGELPWAYEQISSLFTLLPSSASSCWLGSKPLDIAVNTHRSLPLYRQTLGQEFDVAVYNAFDGLRPNAILAIAGTVKRGGVLIILAPEPSHWPYHNSVTTPHFLSYGFTMHRSAFTQHWLKQLNDDTNVAWLQKNNASLPVSIAEACSEFEHPRFNNNDQLAAWHKIIDEVENGRQLCAITAPRGRGKSALLALLALHWQASGKTVWLTSSAHQSQNVFYSIIEKYRATINTPEPEIRWLALDHPDLNTMRPDVLLIDEAAAIPLPVLNTLIATHNQCVLSTTTMGFEGSGLGFIHRFLTPLKRADKLVEVKLEQPLRWFNNDPLESVLTKTLLPGSLPPDISHQDSPQADTQLPPPPCAADIVHQLIKACELTATHRDAVFTLLSSAHYQTSPDDLVRFHDAPDTLLLLTWADSELVGAIAINIEGGRTLKPLAHAIADGTRRVSGHLGAQSLGLLTGESELVLQSYWRISRIAVRDTYRRHGVARAMLKKLEELAQKANIDWLATSFGNAPHLLYFWQQVGFKQVKQGEKTDKASGQTSAFALKPLTQKAERQLFCLEELYRFDTSSHNSDNKNYSSWVQNVVKRRLQGYLNQSRTRQQTGNTLAYLTSRLSQSVLADMPLFSAFYITHLSMTQLIDTKSLNGRKEFETLIRAELTRHSSVLYKAINS